jgi:hypothetical protein
VAVDVALKRPGHPGLRIATVELGGPDHRGEHGPVAGTTISRGATRLTGPIEIVLDDSRRVIVDQDVTAAALARVIGVLERR